MPCSLARAASMPFHHHPPCSPLLDISSAQDATSSRNPPLTSPTQRYVFLSLPPSPYSPCTKSSYALGCSLFYRHTGQLSLSIYCEPALEGQDNLRIRSTDAGARLIRLESQLLFLISCVSLGIGLNLSVPQVGKMVIKTCPTSQSGCEDK